MKNWHLTKSHFVLGQRCHKALYFELFSPELANQSSKLELKLKQDGVEVGVYARMLYPEGKLIDTKDIETAVKETSKYISEGVLTLFEAAFCFDNVVIRADILTRNSIDAPWNLYEVKATTYKSDDKARKADFIQDIAIQVWVLLQSGIALESAYLMHLNSDCIYPNFDSLFISVDYWAEISPLLAEIPVKIKELKSVIEAEAIPDVSIGPHCEKSQDCSFKNTCWKAMPKPSVFNIPRCLEKWDHFQGGRMAIHQLSESDFKSSTHLRVLKCYKEDQPFVDKQAIQDSLQKWQYPISYFDIEAINYTIPRFINSRPYQQIPFQFSCHIQQNKDSEIEHSEFLHDGVDDPRLKFIQKMLEIIPQDGSIVVYHQTYEISRFKELSRDFPEYAQSIDALILRIVDLEKVIKDNVYYPEFMGSFSIKKVAPALLGKEASYLHLEVSDGIEAMIAYQKMLNLQSNDSNIEKIRNDLLEYCKQDTLLMVQLHQWLTLKLKMEYQNNHE